MGKMQTLLRALAAVLLPLVVPGCDRVPGPAARHAPQSFEEPVVEVRVTELRRGSIAQAISASGSVVARRESRIGPRAAT